MSVNKATILGNLGNDPQIKTFDNGGKVAQFAVATTIRGFTTKDGRQVPERTEWHNIVVHGKLAEVVEKYLFKGSKIYLEGELRTRNYTDQQNVTRYITEIHATTFEMLTPKAAGNQTQQQAQPEQTNYSQPQANNDEDDLPF